MGFVRRRFQCVATGLGSSQGLWPRSEKCWQTAKSSASKSALIPIAAGFSTIRPRPGPSAGATTAPAATVPASAGPGRHKRKKPDEEIFFVVRPEAESADQKLGTLPAHEREKFVARLLIVTESAEHGAGHRRAMLLLHTAHLQAAGKHVDHAGDLAEPQNTLVREIGDVGLAEKRQQVVFAEAEEFDVLHDDHLVVGHAERRAVQYMIDVQVVTAGQILERFFETLRRLAQPFAIGILSDELDDFAHVAGDPARVDFFVVLVVQQNFFRWFGHDWFPSGLSPAYSKLLFPVSWTRMRSSFALGKDFKRW